jgi:transaldolase
LHQIYWLNWNKIHKFSSSIDQEAAQQAEKIERTLQTKESFKADLEQDLMAFQLLQGGIDGFIKARDQLSLLLRQSFGIDAEIKLN